MNRIAQYRKAAGLSQKELATLCGNWPPSRIGMYEIGARTPDIEGCKTIVRTLRGEGVNCSLDDVFPIDTSTSNAIRKKR